MENNKKKRASGGNSWADALFRSSADTWTYIGGILERVVRKCNLGEDQYEIRLLVFSYYDYVIIKNKKIIISDTFGQVEKHRICSSFSYEKWLEMRLKSE